VTGTIDDLGEFTLIDRIVARLGDAAAHDILVPPGDDAAAWATTVGASVATIDALAEGTHWRADTMTMTDVGWRAVAANVSDLAAMGADPRYLLVALALPADTPIADVDALTEGMMEACRAHGVRIAGGDIVRARSLLISVAAFGHVDVPDALLRRNGARPGDRVAVSGTPGAAAAGLALIEGSREHEPDAASLVRAHRRPRARTALGRNAIAAGVRAGMDISDGLVQDLEHIARASNVGIEVAAAQLPLAEAAVTLLGRREALDLALGGGEDFELVLCGEREALAGLDSHDPCVTLIGRVVAEHPGEVVVWTEDGAAYEPPRRGWDHARDSGERGAPAGAAR
jgi:thiamine-monophosphate kinase